LGSSRAGALPDLVESRFAHRSAADALDALTGLEHVWTGQYGQGRALGLGQLLRERGSDIDARFAQRFSACRSALGAISAPLDEAILYDRERVQDALDALDALLVFLQVDVTQALAVTVTFGGGDGD